LSAIAIIPARLAATRLPRKPLRMLAGRPMLAWVYDAVRAVPELADVIIATDSNEILAAAQAHGWNARLTSPQHRSGTERVHEVACAVPGDVYLNVQGDEPLTRPEHITELLHLMRDFTVQVGTLKTPATLDDIDNPNAVKVVTDAMGRALYFSRAAIPFERDRGGAGASSAPVLTATMDERGRHPGGAVATVRHYKHLGFYAYRKPALDRFVALPESELERSERLEQLRFLENGIAIHVAATPFNTIGVDTEEDLRRAEELLQFKSKS